MGHLILACVALLVGPLLDSVGRRLRPARAIVDGFALALVGGACVVFVIPHAVGALGLAGLALTGAGVLLPWALHRLGRRRSWSMGLVAVALSVHVVLDGAVLAVGGSDAPLAWAVVAHRLPVGFAIVVAARRPPRTWAMWGLVSAMVLGTLLGFLLGEQLGAAVAEPPLLALEAFVAGLLLHVVLVPHAGTAGDHGPTSIPSSVGCGHGHDGHHHHPPEPPPPAEEAPPSRLRASPPAAEAWAAMGAVLGLVVMLGAAVMTSENAEGASAFLRTLGTLALESAPALLLGYGLAGILPSLLTPGRLSALGRGGPVGQALRGVAFGLPLPVCSCGVLPLYDTLIRRGAPSVAAMAFFVATPELGLDAVLLSVPLLGAPLTAARVASAFAVALLVAVWVGRGSRSAPPPEDEPAEPASQTWRTRLRAGLRFGFVEVFDHTMPWILLGLVIAALAEPMLSAKALEGTLALAQVPVAALIGVPVYVCASGATPVMALALHKGLSAGAAIAFLIAGPATNVTTFGVLARLHGRGAALRFGLVVTVAAMLAGWTVDALGVPARPFLDGAKHPSGTWLAWLSLVLLAALTVASLVRQGPRGALRQILEPIHAH